MHKVSRQAVIQGLQGSVSVETRTQERRPVSAPDRNSLVLPLFCCLPVCGVVGNMDAEGARSWPLDQALKVCYILSTKLKIYLINHAQILRIHFTTLNYGRGSEASNKTAHINSPNQIDYLHTDSIYQSLFRTKTISITDNFGVPRRVCQNSRTSIKIARTTVASNIARDFAQSV
jgi:hypothetical protein